MEYKNAGLIINHNSKLLSFDGMFSKLFKIKGDFIATGNGPGFEIPRFQKLRAIDGRFLGPIKEVPCEDKREDKYKNDFKNRTGLTSCLCKSDIECPRNFFCPEVEVALECPANSKRVEEDNGESCYCDAGWFSFKRSDLSTFLKTNQDEAERILQSASELKIRHWDIDVPANTTVGSYLSTAGKEYSACFKCPTGDVTNLITLITLMALIALIALIVFFRLVLYSFKL